MPMAPSAYSRTISQSVEASWGNYGSHTESAMD
jgi:hypothetical protein